MTLTVAPDTLTYEGHTYPLMVQSKTVSVAVGLDPATLTAATKCAPQAGAQRWREGRDKRLYTLCGHWSATTQSTGEVGVVRVYATTRCEDCKALARARQRARDDRTRERWREQVRKAGPGRPVGSVIEEHDTPRDTSQVEKEFRAALTAAKVLIRPAGVRVQCGWDEEYGNFPALTPDIILSKSRVCVEIDSRLFHEHAVEGDLKRNRLLAEAGWVVIRVRLGGMGALADGDIVSISQGFTRTIANTLINACRNALNDDPDHKAYLHARERNMIENLRR